MNITATDLTTRAAELEATLTRHFAGQDIPDIREQADAFLAAIPTTQARAAENLRAVLDTAMTTIERVREQARRLQTAGADETVKVVSRGPDVTVFAALDRVVSGWDETDLQAANADVERLTAQLAAAEADLQRAITAGDLDTITALRRRIELDIPGDLADARGEVLALEAEAAAAAAAVTEDRARPAEEARAALREQHKAAAREADRLLTQLRELERNTGDDTTRRIATANRLADQARRAADQAATVIAADRVARVRALAGLSA